MIQTDAHRTEAHLVVALTHLADRFPFPNISAQRAFEIACSLALWSIRIAAILPHWYGFATGRCPWIDSVTTRWFTWPGIVVLRGRENLADASQDHSNYYYRLDMPYHRSSN